MNRLKPQQQRKKLVANPKLLILGLVSMVAGEVVYSINNDFIVPSTLLLLLALILVFVSLIHKKERH